MKLINAQFEYVTVLFYLLLFYIGKFFFNKILDRFWKKNVETKYITEDECKKHREEMEKADIHRHYELHKELKGIVAQFKIFNELFVTSIMDNSSLSDGEKKAAMLKLTRNGDGN